MRIKLNGTYNTRDMGGFVAADGRVIRKKRLIRSDALRDLTAADMELLSTDYRLKKIIDLRTEKEVSEKRDPEIEKVDWVHIPLIKGGPAAHKVEREKTMAELFQESIEELDYDAEGAMKKMYADLVTDAYSVVAIKRCFEEFLGSRNGATLFHCTAGKDRTGLIAMLILDVFGVSRKTIKTDHMLTNTYLKPQTMWIAKKISETCDDNQLITQVNILNSVTSEYSDIVLGKVDELAGDGKGYFMKILGFSQGDLDTLEGLYLE